LRQEDFAPNAPGRLVRSFQGHLTFLPSALPPLLVYDPALVGLLSEADLALGELAGVGRMLPNPHLLIRPFVRREAVLSSRIEGTITRLDQVFLFEAQPDELHHAGDVEEVINHVHALELGLERLRTGSPLIWRLLREVHARLLQGVRGANLRPGEFRNCGVMIGRADQGFDDARFVPPCHTMLTPLLDDFERFINVERSLPIVVQLALAHYQFETIHPFMDGNGRLGRLLITLMLCERGRLPQPLLYLSAFFERHDQEYKDSLLEVSRRAAWNEWISFFARGVAEQSRDAASRAGHLLELGQQYRQRVAGTSHSANAVQLVDEIVASPFITVKRAAEALGVTFPTAQNAINRLVNAGILQEFTGQKRNRVYRAREILTLLDDPPEGAGTVAAGDDAAGPAPGT
jgi:Fic family protein